MAVSTQKNLGAYFTPTFVASWLSNWAIRGKNDRVLDPSLGDGVFLEAAARRLKELAGKPSKQIFGCEIDPETHQQAALRLSKQHGIEKANLIASDFFQVTPSQDLVVNVLLGNPPYIRYQRFSGDSRKLALEAAAKAGVKVTQLTSSWAPFLVHACEFLAREGRLGMVLPFEITYANYARPVLDHLLDRFKHIQLLTFQERIFQDISEDTVLLLAEGHGSPCERFEVLSFNTVRDLEPYVPTTLSQVDIGAWRSGKLRLSMALLPAEVQSIYLDLVDNPKLARLGAISIVDIGYVSGNKDFFHLSKEQVVSARLPQDALRPTILNSKDLDGLSFTRSDFEAGKGAWLFYPKKAVPGAKEKAYISNGERTGVHEGYKCRNRSPWWKVPLVYDCHAALTVVSNISPRMTYNEARAAISNSLLTIRFNALDDLAARRQVAAFYTSISQFSAEVEGHSLGGGALKLEPGEAKRILLPNVELLDGPTDEQMEELDKLLRVGDLDAAVAYGDKVILEGVLGYTPAQISQLQQGSRLMRQRRRGKP